MSDHSRTVTATLTTTHDRPTRVRAAIEPDNTDEMQMIVTGQQVQTTITRKTTGGLQATVDDYLVNLGVAVSVSTSCTQYRQPTTNQPD